MKFKSTSLDNDVIGEERGESITTVESKLKLAVCEMPCDSPHRR